MTRRTPRGFTLVELLVVAVLGSFIVLTVYQVLITHSRTYAINDAQIRGQQTLRAGLAVLFGELREISVGQGDILAMGPDSITIRTPRAVALVCVADYSASPQLTARRLGQAIEGGDSIFVFAANEPTTTTDDVWLARRVETSDTTATCGTFPAQTLLIPALASTGDTVRPGALVRSFETYSYGLYEIDGEPYLGRRLSTARTPDPLVGPLLPGSGLEFRYWNAAGSVTASRADVAQIEIILRYRGKVMDNRGQLVRDSLVARVCPRN